ncbi:hypothetical protein P9D42_15600 [Bacillus haynesii]|uniref:hypothetical protein n=1 Tax=Bacillus haynesii TaxID=1925021 RepID=UPI002DB720BA|nr:hypothetical protein [Bacillus haynesii]MEC1507066.1 hypothetical protein [Bacillus haynesii]
MSYLLSVLVSIGLLLWINEHNPTNSEKILVAMISVTSLFCGLLIRKGKSK